MKEIVQLIVKQAGISEGQAMVALEVVVKYVKQHYPALASTLDALLGPGDGKGTGTGTVADVAGKVLGGFFGGGGDKK